MSKLTAIEGLYYDMLSIVPEERRHASYLKLKAEFENGL